MKGFGRSALVLGGRVTFLEVYTSLVAQTVIWVICLQCRRPGFGFDPWVGKIPWRREWLPTPVFVPGEFHGQRSLAGYSPRGRKELDATNTFVFTRGHRWYSPATQLTSSCLWKRKIILNSHPCISVHVLRPGSNMKEKAQNFGKWLYLNVNRKLIIKANLHPFSIKEGVSGRKVEPTYFSYKYLENIYWK